MSFKDTSKLQFLIFLVINDNMADARTCEEWVKLQR